MEYGTGLHVKEVEIDVPSYGNHYTFPCNCWLAQDRQTEMSIKDLNASTPKPSEFLIEHCLISLLKIIIESNSLLNVIIMTGKDSNLLPLPLYPNPNPQPPALFLIFT